jgi:hypothetical protein
MGIEPMSVPCRNKPSSTRLDDFTKSTNSRAPILPSLLATVGGSLKWVAPPTLPPVCNFILLKQLPLTGLSFYKLSTSRSANRLVNKAPEGCSVATYVLIRILRVEHLSRHASIPKSTTSNPGVPILYKIIILTLFIAVTLGQIKNWADK